MSIAAGLARSSLATPPVALPRRRALLAVVPVGDRAAPRAPFAVAVVGLLVSGLIGLLVLNTVLAKDAFARYALQVEGRTLADTEQALTREVEALRSPATLAAKATALGMVQAGPPAFLQLPDGAVLGVPAPAQAPVEPAPPALEPVPAPQAQAPAAPPTAPTADQEQPEDG